MDDRERKDFSLKKALAQFTHMNPTERAKKIEAFIDSIKNSPKCKEYLKSWNVTCGQMSNVEGRRLIPEKILVGDSSQVVDCIGEWDRHIRDKPLLKSIS